MAAKKQLKPEIVRKEVNFSSGRRTMTWTCAQSLLPPQRMGT